jgi:hypothetical protein
MLKASSLFSCALMLLTAILYVQNASGQAKGRLFSLSFENGYQAISAGKNVPENLEGLPQLVRGQHLKAGSFKGKGFLEYGSANNITKTQGTITLWVKIPELQPGGRFCIFKDGGLINAESTALALTFIDKMGLKAGIGNRDNGFILARSARYWQKDEWHHMAFSWNINRGLTLYMDGFLAATKLLEPWKADMSQFFSVGGADDSNIASWQGAIDEVQIFDHELSENEVFADYETFSRSVIRASTIDPFLYADKPDSITVMLLNRSSENVTLHDLAFDMLSNGKQVYKQQLPARSVNSQSKLLLKIPVPAQKAGLYPFTFWYNENDQIKSLTDSVFVLPERDLSSVKPVQKKLSQTIKAAGVKPVAESTPSNIIKSALGEYREAGIKKHDRFALDFHVTEINKPYVAVFKYPDDKPRTMEIILQDLNGHQDYQAQTGIICGDEYRSSNSFKEHRAIFWPKSKDQSFIFMTAEAGRPAAVSQFEVYELDAIAPAIAIGKFSGSVPARGTGIYYEDPALIFNLGEPSTVEGFAKTTQTLLDYMQSFGQTTFNYPTVWYDGPLYTTALVSGQAEAGGTRYHPAGFVNYMLKSLQQRGMKFNASMHLHTLPGLEQAAITSKELVANGTETVLNVRANGSILYNRFHGSDPGFNPIDPRVEKYVADIVNEVGEQFAGQPAFNGVTLVLARVKLFGFGSLESGYNDINLQRFQRESGITIPAYNKNDPNRATESYKWLLTNPAAKAAWIKWRCVKLHDFYKAIADKLSAQRKGLKLTLNMFTPVAFYYRIANYLKENPINALREAGFDPELYKNDANIVLSFTEVPADYRMRRATLNTESGQEAYRTVFTDPGIAEALNVNAFNGSTVIVHDRYWEDDIGKTVPLKFNGYPQAVECKWRVATLNSGGVYSLEPYVFALNNMDAVNIEKGGFLVGTMGMEDELLRFSSAFQKLPAVKFNDVQGLADPVRVRQKEVDGKLFVYVLNCLPISAKVHLTLNKKGTIVEPGTNYTTVSDVVDLEIEPYGLRVFRSDLKGQLVTGGQVQVDKPWVAELSEHLAQINGKMEQLDSGSANIAAQKPYWLLAKKCFEEKKYSRLYFLLQEGWVKEIEKLASK